jgi:Zn-dependent metalloprotease
MKLSIALLSVLMCVSAHAEIQVQAKLSQHSVNFSVNDELKALDFANKKDESVEALRSYAESMARKLVNMPDSEKMILVFDKILLSNDENSLSSVRFNQYLRYDSKMAGRSIPIDGANIVALVNSKGELVNLNFGVVRPPVISDSDLVHFEAAAEMNKHERKIFTKVFNENLTPDFIAALEYMRVHRQKELGIEQSAEEYLKSASGAKERFRRVMKILSSNDTKRDWLQFLALLRKDEQKAHSKRIQLVLNKLSSGATELLWRLTTPFNMPLNIDLKLDMQSKTISVARVSSIFENVIPMEVDKAKSSFLVKDFEADNKLNLTNLDTPKGDAGAVAVATTVQAALNYYSKFFNWQSYDNNSSLLKSYYDVTAESMIQNAAWAPAPFNFFIFGRGGSLLYNFTGAKDVIGHEFTHAVVSATSNLKKDNQSGALNEHIADIMGLAVRHFAYWNMDDIRQFKIGMEVLTPDAKKKYTEKRGQPVDSLRDLLNPKASLSDQAASVSEVALKYGPYCLATSDNDFCGVHEQAGIPNLAVSKIILRLSWTKMKQMFFNTFTKRLRSDSDFADYAQQLYLECGQTAGYTPEQCEVIKSEFIAVGVTPSMVQAAGEKETTDETLARIKKETCDLLKSLGQKNQELCPE